MVNGATSTEPPPAELWQSAGGAGCHWRLGNKGASGCRLQLLVGEGGWPALPLDTAGLRGSSSSGKPGTACGTGAANYCHLASLPFSVMSCSADIQMLVLIIEISEEGHEMSGTNAHPKHSSIYDHPSLLPLLPQGMPDASGPQDPIGTGHLVCSQGRHPGSPRLAAQRWHHKGEIRA